MAYNVRTYSEFKSSSPGTIVVEDGIVTYDDASVGFVGNQTITYSPTFSENDLWLLENFADTSVPLNAVIGQTWFDTNGSGTLKAYNGTEWVFPMQLENVTGDIIPNMDITYDIGSASFRFKDFYIDSINATDAYYTIPATVGDVDVITIERLSTVGDTHIKMFNPNVGGMQIANKSSGGARIDSLDTAGAEVSTWINMDLSGGVTLYYDNAIIAATTTNGLTVTGKATLSSTPGSYNALDLIPVEYISAGIDIITTAAIQDDAITNVKIGDEQVSESKLDVALQNKVNSTAAGVFVGAQYKLTSNKQVSSVNNGDVFNPFDADGTMTLVYNSTATSLSSGIFTIPANVTKVRLICTLSCNRGNNQDYKTTLELVGSTTSCIQKQTGGEEDGSIIKRKRMDYTLSTPVLAVSESDTLSFKLTIDAISNNETLTFLADSSISIEFIEYTV